MQITDNVFVVTGGGNGIGREVALALLARGLDRLSRFSPQRATDLIAKKMASLLAT